MPDLSFHDAIRLPVFWTTASGMLCAMWTYPAVLEQLQPALLAEGLESAGAQLWPVDVIPSEGDYWLVE